MMKKTILPSLLLLGSSFASQAAVIAFSNQEVPIPTTFQGVYIDVESGTTATAPFAGADINFFFGGEGIGNDADGAAAAPSLQIGRTGTNFLDPATSSSETDAIGFGTLVASTGFGGSGSPNDHIGAGASQFVDGERSYLGFSIDIDTGGTVNTHYGYFELTLTDNSAGGVVHAWAYEDQPDTSIVIAPIPEPTTGLLAAIALAAVGLRRRR